MFQCCHPSCKSPHLLPIAIIVVISIALGLLASIALVSTFIAISLTFQPDNSSLVSNPLFSGCSNYPSYEDVQITLLQLQLEFIEIIEVETIGESFEKRDLNIARLSSNFYQEKPKVWIQCGAHGREATTPVTCLTLIYNLAIALQGANKSSNGNP